MFDKWIGENFAGIFFRIEGTPVRTRPFQEIQKLRTESRHIGNNINQIARSINAGITGAEDAKRGLFLLNQVYELEYQAAKKQGGLRMFR